MRIALTLEDADPGGKKEESQQLAGDWTSIYGSRCRRRIMAERVLDLDLNLQCSAHRCPFAAEEGDAIR